MHRVYEWKNIETGEIVSHDHHSEAPDDSGKWQRVYSFALGQVPGAGGSPARPPVKSRV